VKEVKEGEEGGQARGQGLITNGRCGVRIVQGIFEEIG
jgi:hypothetical protein